MASFATFLPLVCSLFVVLTLLTSVSAFSMKSRVAPSSKSGVYSVVRQPTRNDVTMKVFNDAFTRANRAQRQVQAGDRTVEILLPLGMELDEDDNGNAYVKSIEPNGRAAKTGKVFVGDRIAMVSATFGDDMWTCRGVGLNRVLAAIKVRNSKPVKLALEAVNEAEEKKRRAIAFAEKSDAEKKKEQEKNDQLLADMQADDKNLLKKKGFRLW